MKGETTVHLACAIHKGQLHFPGEDTQILQLLLMNGGADHVLKLGGKSQETPLHYVAQTGNADIMSSLFQRLDSGKTQLLVNMQSSKGWSPLCTASSFGHRDCVDLILQVKLLPNFFSIKITLWYFVTIFSRSLLSPIHQDANCKKYLEL